MFAMILPPVDIGRWPLGYRLWAVLFNFAVFAVGLSISSFGLASRATARARFDSQGLAVGFGWCCCLC